MVIRSRLGNTQPRLIVVEKHEARSSHNPHEIKPGSEDVHDIRHEINLTVLGIFYSLCHCSRYLF